MREGEFIYNYSGVMTNLSQDDVAAIMRKRKASFAEAIWRLYDYKAACETYFKDLLDDLGLHHPPCQQHVRNAGFYALGALAHTLGRAVDLIGDIAPNARKIRPLLVKHHPLLSQPRKKLSPYAPAHSRPNPI